MNRQRQRLLLIGLDAGDSNLAHTWAKEGHLPTLAKLLGSGVAVEISTPPAVLEGGVWPTFLTSSTPAAHAMFAGMKITPGTYDFEEAMSADRLPVPPFWAHLSQAGKNVAVIDAPFARPVQQLNGIQVTNWGAHDPWSWARSSWPPNLITDLVTRFGDHPVATCDGKDRRIDEYENLLARLVSGVQKKTALLRHCLELSDWDFFFSVFSESHCVGHQFWHFMDPGHPQHDPDVPSSLRLAIRDVYRTIDGGLASLLEAIDPETHVLLMLSHGMGPWYDGSHLLDLVVERLVLTNGKRKTAKVAVWNLRHFLPERLRQRLKASMPNPVTTLWVLTHPKPTPRREMRAFTVPSHNMTGAIRINLKGREPAGLVEPGMEYEALCRELTDAFLELENAETGRPAVQWVARASELYQGPRLDELPDLFIEWDHSVPIRTLRSSRIGTVAQAFRGHRTGDHSQGGLLVGSGPRFRAGRIKEKIRTQDIAPTILDFFGVAVPRDYEGKSVLPLLERS